MTDFTYMNRIFTPLRALNDGELGEGQFLPCDFSPSNFDLDQFYEQAKSVDSENGEVDLFLCNGEIVIPCCSCIMIFKSPDLPAHYIREQTRKMPSEASVSYLLSVMDDTGKEGFYPTPVSMASEMLAGIDFTLVSTVLEPSAGKGDLADEIVKAFKRRTYGNKRDIDMDCVEINPDLQLILKGKGYRVVHDDFLTYHTMKRYDLIIMNPPFADGDKHLLHALELQKRGGQIVCLLNAETLRNPYTNSRKLLLDQLTEYDAHVTYFEDSFADAQRPTNVSVAMVKVKVPKVKEESTIWEHMKQAYRVSAEETKDEELAPNDTVQRLIREYQIETHAGVELIRQYWALQPYLKDTLNIDEKYKYDILILSINGGHARNARNSSDTLNEYLRLTRLKYWNYILKDEQFIGKLTSDMRSEFYSRLESLADYEFSEFNVRQLLADINVNIFRGVEDALEKLFNQLTVQHTWFPECQKNIHYFNGWKTNKAHKINKKVIIPSHGLFPDYSWSRDTFRVHEAYGHLADIEKCLNYLDGNTTAEVDLVRTLEAANDAGQTKNIKCKFFNVTFYKKGTTHITFTNEKLLEKFNIYCARNRGWLPPRYGKTYYQDMTQEEKTIIDEFQGEQAYNEVLRDRAYYLASTADMVAKLPEAM